MTRPSLLLPWREKIVKVIDRVRRESVRSAELCFAVMMRLVPRQFRFETALLIARATVPLLSKTAAYREQQIKGFHSPSEIVLYLLLNAMSKNGTPYRLEIAVSGYEDFLRSHAKGKGVLVVGHHAALTLLMVRFFHDNDLDPIVISPDPRLPVAGTLVTARTVQPSPMFLVQLRGKLRSGELVCAMPDRAEHHPGRTVEFATPAGRVILAPAMIQVAARCGAEVVFAEVRVHNRRLVGSIRVPSPSSADAPAITADFISFVKECTATHSRSDDPGINSLNAVTEL